MSEAERRNAVAQLFEGLQPEAEEILVDMLQKDSIWECTGKEIADWYEDNLTMLAPFCR